jgi:hypothetical protein
MSNRVEQAAIEWVLAYEREQGREPVDKRYERGFPGDIESPPRVIEVKATSTSYRGWFLPLEPIQLEHALEDPAFHIYVVENIGQGDPAEFTLRILSGERLRELAAKATERRYFEMSWPVASYDQTPVEGAAAEDPAWAKYVIRSDEVPTISAEFLEQERRSMAPDAYAAEYEAVFGKAGASLFTIDQLAGLVLPQKGAA